MNKNAFPIAEGPNNIGIMADSHGRVETLTKGVSTLKAAGCRRLYHLGDICDTGLPETADACTQIIRDNDILAVKGNNEHTLAINYIGEDDQRISGDTARFLGDLPLVRTFPEDVAKKEAAAFFAHSLPFEKELGLSAMVRIVEPAAAHFYFSQYANQILFRGHSHTPEMRYKDKRGKLITEPIPTGETISLADHRPCIITCGALMDDLCMVWNTKEDWIAVLSI